MICPQCGTLNNNELEACVRCKTRLHSPEMAGKIACVNHANREATTSCGGCGSRLCAACAVTANGVEFCENCAPASAVRRTFDEDYERVAVLDAGRAERAPFGPRLLAFVIDGLLVFAAAIVLALLFWPVAGSLDFLSPSGRRAGAFWFYVLLLAAGTGAYVVTLTAMTGQTLGKQIAGVIVLKEDGHILTLQDSLKRFGVSLVSALPLGLGYWWALWDPQKATWHDKTAGTAVFRWEETS